VAILVVEDSTECAERLGDILEELGFQVTIAGDGVAAITIAKRWARPRAVLLGLTLPHLSGVEVAAQLRDDPRLRALPIVTLSGAANAERPACAVAHLEKPFRRDDVMAALRRAGVLPDDDETGFERAA
jgi:CheY-like chemotaxis protein